MHIALVSVVYPGCEPYLGDFFGSILGQEGGPYPIYILDDHSSSDLASHNISNLKVRRPRAGQTPAALRRQLLTWAMSDGYDGIIMADADDYFGADRVRKVAHALKSYPACANDLILIGPGQKGNQSVLMPRLGERSVIYAEDLQQKNCIGLSNGAVRCNALTGALSGEADHLIAYDWMLFTYVLRNHGPAAFLPDVKTYYRQYPQNIASLTFLSDDAILRGIKVKAQHYSYFASHDAWYQEMANLYCRLEKRLLSDANFSQIYCHRVRVEMPIGRLWWEAERYFEDMD